MNSSNQTNPKFFTPVVPDIVPAPKIYVAS